MKILFILALFALPTIASAITAQYMICKPGKVGIEKIDSICFDYTKVADYEVLGPKLLKIRILNTTTPLLMDLTEAQFLKLTKN